MKTFEISLSKERNVTMTMYLNLESPEMTYPARPLMVVLPGGGYAMCSDRESEIVALQYMAAGYQVCILRYTLQDKGGWPHPINDYDQAMEIIAENAEPWHIDMEHTAVVGFSAGGHLAACTATVARHKPRGAICVYPAILKDIVDACQPGMPYPHEHVDRNTSPCYIVTVRDDSLVKCSNSLQFALALEEQGIPFEVHVYSHGNHGFSIGTQQITTRVTCSRVANWIPESIDWLKDLMGALTEKGYTKPVLPPTLNGDAGQFLSIDCTLKYVMQHSQEAKAAIGPVLDAIEEFARNNQHNFMALFAIAENFTLRDLMETMGVDQELLEPVNEALRVISNVP